ncbi:MAG: hypothetical protein ACLFVX_07290 [Archaeoglobaceae archaeon]
MFTLTGFADEISADLKEQIEVLEGEGIKYIELRGVYDKNVLELTDEEIVDIKKTLDKEGIAYNIEAYYFKKNNGTKIVQSRNFVWNGYPSDNAVTVSKTVPLYDSDYGQQGIKTLTYNVDGNTTNLYNLIEVRLTLWRM